MKPHSGRLRIVLTLGTTQTLSWGSTFYLPAILAQPIAGDLGVSIGAVYAAFSLSLVVTALLGPVAGRRIDRYGGRDVLAVSNVVFAVGLTLLAVAPGPLMLYLAWVVIGVGMAMGLYEAAFSTLAGIYGHGARPAITGITLIAGLASTICWPITGLLEAEVGWRGACAVWAAVHVLVALPLNRLLIPLRVQPVAGVEPPTTGRSSTLTMVVLAFVFAVTWFISTAMAAHLPRLLQETGLTAGSIGVAALVGPAQVVGRLTEFTLLGRFHPLVPARLAAVAHPIGALCLLAAGSPAAVLFTLLHGAGNGILTIAKGTLPLALFGPAG